MATSASKAKREAAKKAQAAYFNALNQAERINPLRKVDSNTSAEMDDRFGGEISYGSKRLSMQADKLANKINQNIRMADVEVLPNASSKENRVARKQSRKSINTQIGKYNQRYDEIKRQMNGETIKKNKSVENVVGVGILGLKQRQAPSTILNQQDNNGFFTKPIEKTYTVVSDDQGPINSNYRTLAPTMRAYEDLEGLSNVVAANPVNQFAEQYSAIADKLRAKLKRDTNNVVAGTGLLNTEIVSASPVQEVIT